MPETTTDKPDKDFPPLSEIVRNDNLKEVLDLTDYLTLSEILIVGSRPLSRERSTSEIAEFSQIVHDRFKKMMKFRDNIFLDIMYGIHPDKGLYKREAGQLTFSELINFLDKYAFLIQPMILTPELEGVIDKKLLREVATYRQSIPQYAAGDIRGVGNLEHLRHLESSPLDLVVYYHKSYIERDPYLVFVKRKVDTRIAQKIVSAMINKYKERVKKRERRGDFKRVILLEDGAINDIFGLQFVTANEDGVRKSKEYITQSKNIEVLDVENWYIKTYGPYCAIHIDATWNPNKDQSMLTKRHTDSVEIILMEIPHFLSANFGSEGYWRRMIAQGYGGVQKYYGKSGWLEVERYSKSEMEWIKDRERRILNILGFGRSIHQRESTTN